MAKSNVGIIYITNEGNVGFELGNKHYEVRGFTSLIEIKDVLEYSKDTGFLMIDTNYGEEFFEFYEIPEVGGTQQEIENYFVSYLKEALSKIDKFVVDKKRSKNPLYVNGGKNG